MKIEESPWRQLISLALLAGVLVQPGWAANLTKNIAVFERDVTYSLLSKRLTAAKLSSRMKPQNPRGGLGIKNQLEVS